MRPLARTLSLVLLAALVVAGCGSDDSGSTTGAGEQSTEATQAQEGGATQQAPVGATTKPCAGNGETVKILRVSGVGCGRGEAVVEEWTDEDACRPSDGNFRGACSAGEFRCFSTVFGEGLAVSCARPRQAVNFVFRDD